MADLTCSPFVNAVGITHGEDETLLTPPSTQNGLEFNTPKSSAVKRVLELKGGCKSPALLIPASPMMKRLGYGTGVGVYLLERSPKPSGEIRSPWAIKKITKMKFKARNVVYSDRIEYEASILKQLNHPNVVGYRGFSKPNEATPVLAMEKASNSLGDLIEERMNDKIGADPESTPGPFPAMTIEKVCMDVANALDYLHEEKKLVHGDLKSANVLIFGSFEIAKLCDFGVARKLKDDGTVEGDYIGTEIWNPMEVVLFANGKPKYPITSKADMYPFGLTIYEMLSLQPPHLPDAEDLLSDPDASFDDSAYEELLADRIGTRPQLPNLEFDPTYNKVFEMFYCCTEEDPAKRPTAEDIIALLSLVGLSKQPETAHE